MRILSCLTYLCLLTAPLMSGELEMVPNPPEGFIHLRETRDNNSIDRFLAVNHVTSIVMDRWGEGDDGGAVIVIRTTEVEAEDHGGGSATNSVRHILRFDSKAVAEKALKALLSASKREAK